MDQQELDSYWDRTGEVSYADILYPNSEVEKHVGHRMWRTGIEIGKQLGLNKQSRILDLGCGDGALANTVLAKHFHSVHGFDISTAGIKRAQALAAHDKMRFDVCDVTQLNYSQLPEFDGAYLWGILHHVKSATPRILNGLRTKTTRIVVLEPNGNHILRKLLEHTASYKAAGEDSFRTKVLEQLFNEAGFHVVTWKRINLFPNFTPKFFIRLLKPIEPFIERTPILRALCTVNIWGLAAKE